jgi:amino acid transporter
MLLANILMGTVAWAMLVFTSDMLWLRVDFAWRNDFGVASPRRVHRPCQSMPFTCGRKFMTSSRVSNNKGFVCGWSYWLSRAISFGLELVALQKVMSTWLSDEKYAYMWITIFFIMIVLFNLLNVRRYGEIEFWLTAIKLVTIVGIIFLGLVLPMGASPNTRQLGTSSDYTAIPCPSNATQGQCLETPGFECTYCG